MFRPKLHALLVFFAVILLAATSGAQDARQLQGIESALKASRQKASALAAASAALNKEMAGLQAELVRNGRAAQAAESELSRLEADLADLEGKRAAKAVTLAGERHALSLSLAALQRLAATPPGAVLVAGSPLEQARGSLLLGVAVPELQRRAAVLKADLAALDELGREIAGRQAQVQVVAASLDADRQNIAGLLRRKAELQRQTAAQAAEADARSAKLAGQAKDLRELLDKLARERQQQEQAKRAMSPGNIRSFPTALGSLAAPVAGRLVTRFGALDESGSSSKGILLETRPQAAVVAPFDGQVLFRGPFRSYGEILIIQHAGGYHSVLAGLARGDAAVGQWVLAGEPVGVMGPSGDGSPKLYMELRRDGHPIDPVPWLGKTDSKVE